MFPARRNTRPEGALSRPRVLEDGGEIEKAAVQFTHSLGASLPPAATERNPQLAGQGFQAVAISLIVHPRNPYVPTTHANLRFFLVEADEPVWYFGGGFDLTPYYGFEDRLRALAPAGASRNRRSLPGLQTGVRRVLLSPSPPGVPRHRRGVLRRLDRRRFRDQL